MQVVPVLAIRNTVLFPPFSYPLDLTRDKSKAAVQAAGEGGHLVCVAQEVDSDREPESDDLFTMGTLVVIERVRATGEDLEVVVKALERQRVCEYLTSGTYIEATVEPVEALAEDDTPGEAFLAGRVLGRFESRCDIGKEQRFLLGSLEDNGTLADMLASLIDADVEVKQGLLETPSPQERLRRLLELTE